MLKVVFDTNIYISAILFGGIPKTLLDLVIEGKYLIFISNEILSEISAVLIKKFNFSEIQMYNSINFITNITHAVYPKKTVKIIKNFPSDNRILECALKVRADYIITGDTKHILSLKKFKSSIIMSPKQFKEILLNNHS